MNSELGKQFKAMQDRIRRRRAETPTAPSDQQVMLPPAQIDWEHELSVKLPSRIRACRAGLSPDSGSRVSPDNALQHPHKSLIQNTQRRRL